MNQGIVNVHLYRDGDSTPWGFRLLGGVDVGMPLTIQRVFLGSPSEGELHRGDVILRVGSRDAARLTHQEAHDIIKNAGNNISLVVQRTGGAAPISPVASPGPMSPVALANVQARVPSPCSFASLSQTSSSPTPGTKPNDYLFRPLPKTHFPGQTPGCRTSHAPEPHLLDSIERHEYMNEKEWERYAITAQPFRSSTLITPKAKPRHDIPCGSYLRHVQDPSWNKPPPQPVPANKISEALMIATKDGSAKYSPVSLSPGRTPTPDAVTLVHRQYNSPLPIYSTEAVAHTLTQATGLQPSIKDPLKSLPVGMRTISNKSPTLQMIHDQEMKDLSSGKLREHQPASQYVVPSSPDQINFYGLPHQYKIQQAPSFNLLRRSLLVSPPK